MPECKTCRSDYHQRGSDPTLLPDECKECELERLRKANLEMRVCMMGACATLDTAAGMGSPGAAQMRDLFRAVLIEPVAEPTPINPTCELCGEGMASHMLHRVCPTEGPSG